MIYFTVHAECRNCERQFPYSMRGGALAQLRRGIAKYLKAEGWQKRADGWWCPACQTLEKDAFGLRNWGRGLSARLQKLLRRPGTPGHRGRGHRLFILGLIPAGSPSGSVRFLE